MADVVVTKSKIEGKGVFAGRKFRKGEIILIWDTSHELTFEQAKKLRGKDIQYLNYFKGKCIMMQRPERFVNHSCNANTTAINFCDVAKRDIDKGEEITANYEEEASVMDMICKCGI